jgi:hypothetical protein
MSRPKIELGNVGIQVLTVVAWGNVQPKEITVAQQFNKFRHLWNSKFITVSTKPYQNQIHRNVE